MVVQVKNTVPKGEQQNYIYVITVTDLLVEHLLLTSKTLSITPGNFYAATRT